MKNSLPKLPSNFNSTSIIKFVKENVPSYIGLTLGIIIAAFAIEYFMLPHMILDGGITGISMIISKLTPLHLSILITVLNIPFLAIGYFRLGFRFTLRAAYSLILYAVMLAVFSDLPHFEGEMLLVTTFGGGLFGLGAGLAIRNGGCTDGTDTLAIIISDRTTFSVGQIMLIINLFVYTIGGLFFGIDKAMYALLAYFVSAKAIDNISEGLESAKSVKIVADKEVAKTIADSIYHRLGRTCTYMESNGKLSGSNIILYCVVTRMELPEIRSIIKETKSEPFTTITDVSEVIGNHIKKFPKK